MSTLSKFNTPKFSYECSSIEDSMDRQAAKSAVEEYEKSHLLRVTDAEELVKEDNLAKSKCVFTLKETLIHGQFLDVCQEALGLNNQTAAAMASTGRLLMEGDHTKEVEAMVRVMDPRAARSFLQASDQAKHDHVVTFESTGHVPSRRDFSPSPSYKKSVEPYASEATYIEPTISDSEAGQRLQTYKIRPIHFLGWLNTNLSSKSEVSEDMKAELSNLAFQLNRLNITA